MLLTLLILQLFMCLHHQAVKVCCDHNITSVDKAADFCSGPNPKHQFLGMTLKTLLSTQIAPLTKVFNYFVNLIISAWLI